MKYIALYMKLNLNDPVLRLGVGVALVAPRIAANPSVINHRVS